MSKNVATLTSKGQVTVPVKIRNELGIGENALLKFKVEGKGFVVTPIQTEPNVDLRDYSTEEIDEFVANDTLSEDDRQFFNRILANNGS